MDYNFSEIERRWQKYWNDNKTYKVEIDPSRPKFYVLDMFPYPSGAGLHVGHPLGYIASDIYSRYKRLQGYNVLHPMGYDSFGLPAEQYAIQTGQHPAATTEKNIAKYRSQLDKIGFSYDWEREVRTSDPSYYKWTQWVFVRLYNHWYNNKTQRAEPIEKLIEEFKKNGNTKTDAACTPVYRFHGAVWNGLSEAEKQEILMNYRLSYLAETSVNWCPELGTVLANDEVKEGVSVRGGHPVVQRRMKQWLLRITAYAERLLNGLNTIEWSDSLTEMQRNWIGKSEGAEMFFAVKGKRDKIQIFTTRPDTIFGATFMVMAPEHEMVKKLTTKEQKDAVQQYIAKTQQRTERERMSDVKHITGVFTGSYAINPFTNEPIPIWLSDYVLAGYGTGAIMAVPAHDSRDYAFARHFALTIVPVVAGGDISEQSYDAKEGKMINSGFINGMEVKDAIQAVIAEIENREIGKRKINYRLRDAIFSRQRYWGEPFPVYYKDDVPYMMSDDQLPLLLPEIDQFKPTDKGEPPLARSKNWKTKEGYPIEYSTMPGFAGSSGYYIRYMDPRNDKALASPEAVKYWQDVDLYIGGTEHAVGHLVYSRFWNKFLFDIGVVVKEEPFKKLINQGMIQGRSNFVHRINKLKYAEYLVWEYIKNGARKAKFSRDFKIGANMYHFVSEEANVVIEMKNHKAAPEFYAQNVAALKKAGYKLLVLSYDELMTNPEWAYKAIDEVLSKDGKGGHSADEGEAAPVFVSLNVIKPEYNATPIHVDVNMVRNDLLDVDRFRAWNPEYKNARFIFEDGDKYVCSWAIEKMSKSMFNVVNPDDIVEQYGADTLRLYEMFLGPIEQAKPWDTNGIEGVHRFLRKFWRLFHDNKNNVFVSDEAPTPAELKTLHRTIKKVQQDIENFSMNTAISNFMICVNELNGCNKRAIVEPLAILLSPFAPHITEEVWHLLGHRTSITQAAWVQCNESYLVENSFTYPVSFNGKVRYQIQVPATMSAAEVEQTALQHEHAAKWMEGKAAKKVIVVQGRIVNVVL